MMTGELHETASTLPENGCTEVAEPEEIYPADDPVNHPAHYTSGSIECIDYIDSCGYGLDFCLANAIKYLTRCKLKGTMAQDIRKAIWYAEHAAKGVESGKYPPFA